MGQKTLHILNGDSLKDRLDQVDYLDGDVMIWREMLCEGPTIKVLESEESLQKRREFLKRYYRIPFEDYNNKFVNQLDIFRQKKNYDEIVLWFEYDLFCHINLIAAISLLLRSGYSKSKITLVCSGWVGKEKQLLGLCEINEKQLLSHYGKRSILTTEDLEFADFIWTIYCEADPHKFAGQIKKQTSFQYLSSCLRAHLQRFPNMLTGLNTMEHNILEMVNNYQIKNTRQLLGYALEYQGYYGYGDMQMKRVVARLFQFFNQTDERLLLSDRGILAIEEKKNFYNTQQLEWYYGGVRKYDFLYDKESHKLLKL